MNELVFDHVYKTYSGDDVWAVEDVSLTIPAESFVVFLGPSGCGKTTLLKMVNRLYEPTKGDIYIDGKNIRDVEPTELRRRMGYAIQQVGLFPHMTVERNIATVPKLLGWEEERIHHRVTELLALMSLDPETFSGRYPSQLSGGQQQRVGIARALAADPDILLMDEPFGAIDAITRLDLQEEIAHLHQKLRKTILFVTHDVDEALRLADYIAVMREGKLVQFARPVELLNHPADEFTRKLLNADDRIRQMGLLPVKNVMTEIPYTYISELDTIGENESIREALSKLLSPDIESLLVVNDKERVGYLTLDDIINADLRDEA